MPHYRSYLQTLNKPHMRIALIGYGKMGKAIEEIALERGHEIVLKINRENREQFTREQCQQAEVAIEFTSPHTAFDNLHQLISWRVPVVCGSTGFTDRLPELEQLTLEQGTTLLYASNFSVGVNIFFEVNKVLASLMQEQPGYEVSMEEIHHTHKLDAPSGTAITLATQILDRLDRKAKWVEGATDDQAEIGIVSKRIDPAPGTHSIRYNSEIDDIEIIHTAHNRKGFATGAVLAAEFIKGKHGVFGMKDVLGL